MEGDSQIPHFYGKVSLTSCNNNNNNFFPKAVMLAKESIITPEIIKEREDRHRRLLKMIKNFKRTPDDVRKLERIKDNTVLEINIRHLRSEHNRTFKFPKSSEDSESEDPQPDHNPFFSREAKLYDLRAQNEVTQPKIIKIDIETSRRVKSLNQQRNDLQENRLGRFQQTNRIKGSYKQLRKKSLVVQKRVYSTIKLPELLRKQAKEQTKTQGKNDSFQMHKIIGKKLATESSSPSHNQQGLGRYLKSQRTKNEKSRRKIESYRRMP